MSDPIHYGVGGKTPTPARPTAITLADAFSALVVAREELTEAELNVPDYTGQWSTADYTAAAQEVYNRAADAFEDALVASIHARPKVYPCGRMVEPPRASHASKESS